MESARVLDSYCEVELLERVARKDAEALACFYDRTSAVLFSVAKSILRDTEAAEDVLQDVYVQIWEKAELYNPALGKPIAWVIALTRNKALDRLRSSHRRASVLKEAGESAFHFAPDASKTADANVEMVDAAQTVKRAMQELPEQQRLALEFSLLQGLPHAEIAEVMQAPLGTVKAWIRRGIIDLRVRLQKYL